MSTNSPNTPCGLCEKPMTPRGMGRHLSSCLEKNIHLIADQSGESPGILHLKVHGGGKGSPYWLHLAVDQDVQLKKLDSFLRDMWLECCGHASTFFQGRPYTSEEVGMNRKLNSVLDPGEFITHIYDFGTETMCVIEALERYPGRIKGKNKLALLARNPAPEFPCEACGREAAEYICQECSMEGGEDLLCRSCRQGHECDEEMLVRLMNSPRAGECAYGSEYV